MSKIFTSYNQGTAILFMPRKYTNESGLYVSMDNSGNKNQSNYATEVKVPNYNQVIIKENVNADKKAEPIWAESKVGICNNFQFTKEEVIEDLRKNGLEVVHFEPVEIRLLDKCLNCGLVGRPKFDRRPNDFDYHVRSRNTEKPSKLKPSYDTESVNKLITNRPDDFTLTYSHKINGVVKKCVIGKLDKNHMNVIKDGKIVEELKKYLFPYYIKSMKNA